jgi:hypothetical protein
MSGPTQRQNEGTSKASRHDSVRSSTQRHAIHVASVCVGAKGGGVCSGDGTRKNKHSNLLEPN